MYAYAVVKRLTGHQIIIGTQQIFREGVYVFGVRASPVVWIRIPRCLRKGAASPLTWRANASKVMNVNHASEAHSVRFHGVR